MADVPEDPVTVREFIEWLIRAANNLPATLDSLIGLAICDGQGRQFIQNVEVTWEWLVNQETGENRPAGVLIVGHWHPGETPGEYRRAMAEGADEELRGPGTAAITRQPAAKSGSARFTPGASRGPPPATGDVSLTTARTLRGTGAHSRHKVAVVPLQAGLSLSGDPMGTGVPAKAGQKERMEVKDSPRRA
jgi:hypothetical protein